jgi:hypothetical protein
MNKLKSFVLLDFITVKPYFTAKNLLIYSIVALLVMITSKNVSSAIGVILVMATMFVSYPFAVGEKSNMDALYTTLALDKKTVVLGRYAFMLAMNCCAILFSIVIWVIGTLASYMFKLGFSSEVNGALAVISALTVMSLMIQSLQIPMFFKLGYTKAKFFTLIPFIGIMVSTMALSTAADSSSGLFAFVTFIFRHAIASALLIAAAMILMVYVSYRLSAAFYAKREF